MRAVCVHEPFRCLRSKALAVGRFSVKRSHGPACPAKQCLELGDDDPISAPIVAASLRRPCAHFLTPAALQAFRKSLPKLSFVSGEPFKPQIHARSRVGPAASPSANSRRIEMLISTRPWLFSVRKVTTPSRTSQHRVTDPLTRAELPSRLVPCRVVLGPCRETRSGAPGRVLHAECRIHFHQSALSSPAELTTHGIEESCAPALGWQPACRAPRAIRLRIGNQIRIWRAASSCLSA